MKQALRFVVLFIIGFFSYYCHGQSTNVSLTVISPPGQEWLNGTVSYKFKPTPNFPGNSQWQGADLPSNYLVVTTLALNGSGSASFSLPSNTAITPAGSMWTITVCPKATVQCVTTDLAVSGTTQDISSPINANLNAISVQGLNVPLAYSDSEIKTTVRTGAMYINTTRNVPEWFNGTAWQDFGGGGGALPQGSGTNQFANAGATAFISGGTYDSDAFGGLIPTQTSRCTTGSPNFSCSVYIPSGSSDTELGKSLPMNGTSISSVVEDRRYNSLGLFFTNSIPTLSGASHFELDGPTQTGFTSVYAYPLPFPSGYGFNQGSPQQGEMPSTVCTVGYSMGPINRDINLGLQLPAPGYPDVNGWAGCNGQWIHFIKSEAAIAQAQTYFVDCLGIGDCQGQAWFVRYAGGMNRLSDEGIHAWGEMHLITPGNTVGAIDQVIDTGAGTGLTKFHMNASIETGHQGQERFAMGAPIIQDLNADQIVLAVGFSNVPSSVIFNDGTFTPSTAAGVVTGHDCVPFQQQEGVGLGMNNGVVGCDILVTTGFGVGHFVGENNTANPPLMCGAFHTGGLFNIGMEPINVTAITGGHQTITMSMRNPLPIGSVIYQGGTPGCSYGVDWKGDWTNSDNGTGPLVAGQVVPVIAALDAHTLLIPTYFASNQTYTSPLVNSSHSGTRALTGPHALGFTATLTRQGGVVSAIMDTSFYPVIVWNGTVFFTVANCSISSFNGPVGVFTRMPGPNPRLVQWNQAGPDELTGCTGALMTPNGTHVNIVPLAIITNVSNMATDGSVNPDQSVDGTIWTTMQPNFATIGNIVTIPPWYGAGGDMLNLGNQVTQPMVNYSTLSINLIGNGGQTDFDRDFNQAIRITNSQRPEVMLGSGGNGVAADGLSFLGPFPMGRLISSTFAPIPLFGAVINIGRAYDLYLGPTVNDTFRDYNFLCASGSDLQDCTMNITVDMNSDQFGFGFEHQTNNIILGLLQSSFNVPTTFTNLEISTNIGGLPLGNYVPTTAFGECTTLPGRNPPGPLACNHRALTHNANVTALHPGTTRLTYRMIGNDDYGLYSTTQYVVLNTGIPSPTNTISLPCTDLPTGKTGVMYLDGLGEFPVGTCTSSSTVLVDNGTYGTTEPGANPWIAGVPIYSGGFLGNVVGFLTSDQFGASGDPSIPTAFISQLSAGNLLLSGATLGDGQGSLKLLNIEIDGTCTGAGCGGGGGGIANIIITLPTSSIGANACTTPVTTAMTGVLTSSALSATFATNPNSVTGWGTTGGLVFTSWPTANALNWSVCNQTASPITPGAMNLNIGAH